jgi:hypothetical protein
VEAAVAAVAQAVDGNIIIYPKSISRNFMSPAFAFQLNIVASHTSAFCFLILKKAFAISKIRLTRIIIQMIYFFADWHYIVQECDATTATFLFSRIAQKISYLS